MRFVVVSPPPNLRMVRAYKAIEACPGTSRQVGLQFLTIAFGINGGGHIHRQ